MAVVIPQVITEDRSSGAQVIDGSLRFDSKLDDEATTSQRLARTFGSDGDTQKMTMSVWVKRTSFTSTNTDIGTKTIFGASTGGGNRDQIRFEHDASGRGDQFSIFLFNDAGTGNECALSTAAKFRDAAGWYHLVIAIDTTQGTATDRVKFYVNGVQITDFELNTQPGQNFTINNFNDNIAHEIGRDPSGSNQAYDGYMSNFYWIDGQQLDASYFGFTDPLTNTWRPKKYTGTYGTNGFYLPMDGNSPIGEDKSGNGNNWTPVNFGGYNTLEKATGAFPILNTVNGGRVATAGVRTDANASDLVLALPLVGSSADVSNQINSGSTTKTLTANGNAAASSTQSNFYGGSYVFDGSGDYIASTETDIGTFGTGDFTVEYWCRNNSTQTPNYSPQVGNLADTSAGGTWRVGTFASSGHLYLATHNGSGFADYAFNTINYNDNVWHHFCVQRSSGTVTAYVDGVLIGTATVNIDFNASKPIQIGREGYSPTYYTGHIQDLRIYKGVAKYTSNFIPASTDPDILPDTPSGVAGGSALTKITDGAVYFDGDGDNLTVPETASDEFTFGTGDWTIEGFVYFPVLPHTEYNTLVTTATPTNNQGIWFGTNNNGLWWANTAPAGSGWLGGSTGVSAVAKKWYHFAYVRNSDVIKVYIDGVEIYSRSDSSELSNTNNSITIGGRSSSSQDSNSYLSNVRVVKGTALYTSNFTPPTEPLTNVTNTKLLCCQDNTRFITGGQPILNTNSSGSTATSGTRTDRWTNSLVLALPLNGSNGGTTFTDQSAVIKGSGSAKTITVTGNVRTSTLQSKYYGSSALFDGSGDGLKTNSSSDFTFGIGALTLECWLWRTNVTSGYRALLADNLYGSTGGWSLYTYQDEIRLAISGGPVISADGVVTAQTWTHIALQRGVSNDWTLYVNGVSVATATNSTNLTDTYLLVGANNFNSSYPNYVYDGHIQDVRVYKGVAKYSGNFTVTAPSVEPISAVAPGSIIANGNSAATNFNPFTTDINAVRGQESGYATLNPVARERSGGGRQSSSVTLTNGNLSASNTADSGVRATMAVSSGKWYYEATKTSSVQHSDGVGWESYGVPDDSYYAYYRDNGADKVDNVNSSAGTWATFTNGDVIGAALDLDANTITFYKNGILVFSKTANTSATEPWGPGLILRYGAGSGAASSFDVNFGQKPFKYAPPEGHKTLCLANLPRPTEAAVRPDKYFNTVIYTGNATERTIDVGFQPDLVWGKTRSNASSHNIVDSVRGVKKLLSSNTTDAELTESDTAGIDSFVSNGFTLEDATFYEDVNQSGRTYVAWCWKAGGSVGTFNVDDVDVGSAAAAGLSGKNITPTACSIGTKQGFSIIKYTGNGSTGQTVPHGLTQAPSFILTKSLNETGSPSVAWGVFHKDGSYNNSMVYLTQTAGKSGDTNVYTTTSQTNEHFTIGDWNGINQNTTNYISYIWHDVPGLQKFGTFEGNGSADGPFVELGFRPAMVIVRGIDNNSRNWLIDDATRNPYNGKVNTSTFSTNYATLAANSASSEPQSSAGTFEGNYIDHLSNGFKLRSTAANSNGSETYIYAAWAEAPTNNLFGGQANAR